MYSLRRPAESKVDLRYPGRLIKHLQQLGTLYCRIPLLPQLRCNEDGLPGIERDGLVTNGYFEYSAVDVLARLAGTAVDDDIREVG